MLKVTNLKQTGMIKPLMLRAYIAKKMTALMDNVIKLRKSKSSHRMRKDLVTTFNEYIVNSLKKVLTRS